MIFLVVLIWGDVEGFGLMLVVCWVYIVSKYYMCGCGVWVVFVLNMGGWGDDYRDGIIIRLGLCDSVCGEFWVCLVS